MAKEQMNKRENTRTNQVVEMNYVTHEVMNNTDSAGRAAEQRNGEK